MSELLNNQAKERIYGARKVAVLTGAGISAESGIPTFRDTDGLWTKFSPMELSSFEAFYNNTAIVAEWYKKRRHIIEETMPNPGHYALAEIEKKFQYFDIITQNIDGLHSKAGSNNIIEIHGNIMKNYCIDCKKKYSAKEFDTIYETSVSHIPRCNCGGLIRPDVVWFGELLPKQTIEKAFQKAEKADIFFSIGTSAMVRPASDLPITAIQNGAFLIEINMKQTHLSDYTHLQLNGPSGKILPQLLKEIEKILHD